MRCHDAQTEIQAIYRAAHIVVLDAHSSGTQAELDAGGPHDNVAHCVDQNALPWTLVERNEFAHARHSICRAHKAFLERTFESITEITEIPYKTESFYKLMSTPLALRPHPAETYMALRLRLLIRSQSGAIRGALIQQDPMLFKPIAISRSYTDVNPSVTCCFKLLQVSPCVWHELDMMKQIEGRHYHENQKWRDVTHQYR